MYYTRFNTEICEIILAGDEDGLKILHPITGKDKRDFKISPDWRQNDSFFEKTIKQINEYLSGKLRIFDVSLAPEGTEFQKRVWSELLKIPFGEVRTYGEIAAALGNKNTARAIGMANGRNPIPLIIPCHRVIGSNGSLTGFAYGLKLKQRLLEIESENSEQ